MEEKERGIKIAVIGDGGQGATLATAESIKLKHTPMGVVVTDEQDNVIHSENKRQIETFIFSARPPLEEPFFPKGLDNKPWYHCFSNKKRRKH